MQVISIVYLLFMPGSWGASAADEDGGGEQIPSSANGGGQVPAKVEGARQRPMRTHGGVSLLPHTGIVGVSHAWGRWREGEGKIRREG